jgi:L-glyceraldehyde 3-phosphate reductase
MNTPNPFTADAARYQKMRYRRSGRSGVELPMISLGFWQNFGDDRPLETQRAVMRRAFDLGITHFDLANNYGPPYGAAEVNAGRVLADDFRRYRDELIISTKAGWDMWPGPYGDHGSRKYLLASLDQSLTRLGLDYVDVFYSHRPDPTPRWKKLSGPCTPRCSRVRRSTSASLPTDPNAPAKPPPSCATSARRC